MPQFPLFPPSASTLAPEVDALYFYLIAISAFFVVLIATLVVIFAFRYRRRRIGDVGEVVHPPMALEVFWIAVPTLIALTIFLWGAKVYFAQASPPPETVDIYVVAKQWMFKFQHMGGQREIDELHLPAGRAVRLTMTSEDVIHDLFIPAFRTKADIIPGRYTTIWFTPNRPGTYHLFCAEYCGTQHSGMIGQVVVMEPNAYQTWLAGGPTGGGEGSMASTGEKLFQDLGCITCHRSDGQGRGPVLQGVFGKPVQLADGTVVVADEAYVRESILNPTAKIVAGFQPLMPTFQGLVTEEQLLQLVEYVKSLAVRQQAAPPQGAKPTGPSPTETTPARPPRGPAALPPKQK